MVRIHGEQCYVFMQCNMCLLGKEKAAGGRFICILDTKTNKNNLWVHAENNIINFEFFIKSINEWIIKRLDTEEFIKPMIIKQ